MKKLMQKMLLIGIAIIGLVAVAYAANDFVTTLFVNNRLIVRGNTIFDSTAVSVTGSVSGSTLTLPAYGTLFYLNDTTKITRILPGSGSREGRIIVFACRSNLDSLADGVNIKLASAFNATVDDMIILMQIDTFFVEVARSAN